MTSFGSPQNRQFRGRKNRCCWRAGRRFSNALTVRTPILLYLSANRLEPVGRAVRAYGRPAGGVTVFGLVTQLGGYGEPA